MEERYFYNIIQKGFFRAMPFAIAALLVAMFQSCVYEPYEGFHVQTIPPGSKSSVESRAKGAFMARYTPEDSIIEYHDSLIDIKFNIVEAYLELENRLKYRFPPYKKEHYRLLPYYQLVIVCDIDSCCTINSNWNYQIAEVDWWSLGSNDGFYNRNHYVVTVPYEYLGRLNHNPTLDTLEIPILLGWTYKDLVWKNWRSNGNRLSYWLVVQKMKFILEDTNFQGDIFNYSSAQQALTKEYERILKVGYIEGDRAMSVSEMDSLYPRTPKDELMKKLLQMYTDLASTPREK